MTDKKRAKKKRTKKTRHVSIKVSAEEAERQISTKDAQSTSTKITISRRRCGQKKGGD